MTIFFCGLDSVGKWNYDTWRERVKHVNPDYLLTYYNIIERSQQRWPFAALVKAKRAKR